MLEYFLNRKTSNHKKEKNRLSIDKVKTLFIGCIDPRVNLEKIFNLDKEAFIYRTKANIICPSDMEILSMLEFLIEQGLENIILCGHYDCRGVEASLNSENSHYYSIWLKQIKDIYDKNQNSLKDLPREEMLKELCLLNTKLQLKNLSNVNLIKKALKEGKNLTIEGCIYDPLTEKIEKV